MSSDDLYSLLTRNPNDWFIDHYYATHKTTKVKFWIANGVFSFSQEGGKPCNLGLFNKWALYYWLSNVSRQQISNLMQPEGIISSLPPDDYELSN